MKRLHISFDVVFGDDEEQEIQPQGDVFSTVERSEQVDHEVPPVGFRKGQA